MVTTSPSYRNTAHGVYITAMAIADITFLFTQPLNRGFVHDLFGWDIRSYSVAGCKVYYFFHRWAKPMSSLVIVLICIERFVAIWIPLKARSFSSRRTAMFEICGIFALACFTSGFRTQTAGVKNDVCLGVVVGQNTQNLKTLCSIMGMTIRTLIPTTALLLFTPPTIVKLFYQRHLRRQLSDGKSNHSDETFRVSLMLLSVAIAFCVLITPYCVIKHGYLFIGVNIVTKTSPAFKILNEVRLICEQLNCVINFVLYVLISREFRRHFYAIMKCQQESRSRRRSAVVMKRSFNTVSSTASRNRLGSENSQKTI